MNLIYVPIDKRDNSGIHDPVLSDGVYTQLASQYNTNISPLVIRPTDLSLTNIH